MMWVCIGVGGTFERADTISNISGMVRVYLDPVILAQGADIREEHREVVCTCQFDISRNITSSARSARLVPIILLCFLSKMSRLRYHFVRHDRSREELANTTNQAICLQSRDEYIRCHDIIATKKSNFSLYIFDGAIRGQCGHKKRVNE
jgi:hypothetical protein